MYKFALERDHQQSTVLSVGKGNNQLIVKVSRIQAAYLHQPQNNLQLDFGIHQNSDTTSRWTALQFCLRDDFKDIIATELLPTCSLKVHLFMLQQDKDIQAVMYNAVWVALVLHGVPLKRSIYRLKWDEGVATLDLNNPQNILSCQKINQLPQYYLRQCQQYKEIIENFLKQQWIR